MVTCGQAAWVGTLGASVSILTSHPQSRRPYLTCRVPPLFRCIHSRCLSTRSRVAWGPPKGPPALWEQEGGVSRCFEPRKGARGGAGDGYMAPFSEFPLSSAPPDGSPQEDLGCCPLPPTHPALQAGFPGKVMTAVAAAGTLAVRRGPERLGGLSSCCSAMASSELRAPDGGLCSLWVPPQPGLAPQTPSRTIMLPLVGAGPGRRGFQHWDRLPSLTRIWATRFQLLLCVRSTPPCPEGPHLGA